MKYGIIQRRLVILWKYTYVHLRTSHVLHKVLISFTQIDYLHIKSLQTFSPKAFL